MVWFSGLICAGPVAAPWWSLWILSTITILGFQVLRLCLRDNLLFSMIIHADTCFLSRENKNNLEMITVLMDYKWSVLPNKQIVHVTTLIQDKAAVSYSSFRNFFLNIKNLSNNIAFHILGTENHRLKVWFMKLGHSSESSNSFHCAVLR